MTPPAVTPPPVTPWPVTSQSASSAQRRRAHRELPPRESSPRELPPSGCSRVQSSSLELHTRLSEAAAQHGTNSPTLPQVSAARPSLSECTRRPVYSAPCIGVACSGTLRAAQPAQRATESTLHASLAVICQCPFPNATRRATLRAPGVGLGCTRPMKTSPTPRSTWARAHSCFRAG
jgi:hypothetical protein